MSDFGQLPAPPRRRRPAAPTLQVLESRRLLSFYAVPSANLPVVARGGVFSVQVSSGPGVVEAFPAPGGAIDLKAYGTTANTTITIIQTKPRLHVPNQLLAIDNLVVRSGQLGGLSATQVELTGRMTTLTSSLNNFDIGTLGPRSQVDILGGVGELSASRIDLGPTGHFAIAEGINAPVENPSLSSTSSISSSLLNLLTLGDATIGTMNIDGGRFTLGGDSTLPITIENNLTISRDGELLIGRDEDSTFTVDGSLVLSSGGQYLVGRNMNDLTVVGNVIVEPNGSGIAVGGALNSLTVDGYFQGQGGTTNPSAVDLGVGLNLSGLTILGGVSGQGGLVNANVRAGGTVSGEDIAYGLYNSTIQGNTAMAT